VTTGALIRRVRLLAGLSQAELARRAGTSQPAVARYEGDLSSPAVATLERLLRAAGAELVLSVEPAPASDLSSSRAAALRRHRGEVRRLLRTIGARNARVFGSVARGDDDEASDIDLVVDYPSDAGLLPLIRLRRELSGLVGFDIDLVPFDALRADVAERVLAEAIPL
jgi:predicted nucleotidyltransferase/DNA-binding XRE family transcriptional regulator